MLVCVECGEQVPHLYREFGKGNIRLTHCEKCGSVADKYVEYEALVLLYDMLLHKPSVYRHILYNRDVEKSQVRFMIKLSLLIVLCDAYLRCDRYYASNAAISGIENLVSLYLSACLASALGFTGYVASVAAICAWALPTRSWQVVAVATALATFPKLLVVVMWVWDYRDAYFAQVLSVLCISSSAEAIRVVMQWRGYWQAYGVAIAATLASATMQLLCYHTLWGNHFLTMAWPSIHVSPM